MKRLAIFLSIILVTLFFRIQDVFSQVEFYDDLTAKILERVNTFRSSPLTYLDLSDAEMQQVEAIWGEEGVNYLFLGLPSLFLDTFLTMAAKGHLEDMLNAGYISHLSQDGLTPEERVNQYGYDAVLIGESIAFLCFENYVSPLQAVDILLKQLFKDALFQQTAEGAPLVFAPYEDIGIALAGGTFEVEGKVYNVYGMCLLFGINKDTSQRLIVGRVYFEGNYRPLANIEVNLKKDDVYMSTNTFSDGSYFFFPFLLSGEAVIEIEYSKLNLSPYFEIRQKRVNLDNRIIRQDFILPVGLFE